MEIKQKSLEGIIELIREFKNTKPCDLEYTKDIDRALALIVRQIIDKSAELYAGQTKESDSPCLIFVPKTDTSSATICQNCGREKFTHFQEHQSPEKWQPIDQSSPVSIDIIDEAVRFRDNFDYTSCLTSTGIKTGEAVMNSFIEGAKWQSQQPIKLSQIAFSEPYQNLQREYAELKQKLESQQPASVAFFSEEEIEKTIKARFGFDESTGKFEVNYKVSDRNFFKCGIYCVQAALRKRVFDPVELLNWIFDNARKGFDKNIWFMDVEGEPVQHSTQELLQIYLTSKTK